MELLYITHGTTAALSWPVSWAVVIGGVYGCCRLVIDVAKRLFRRRRKAPSAPT